MMKILRIHLYVQIKISEGNNFWKNFVKKCLHKLKLYDINKLTTKLLCLIQKIKIMETIFNELGTATGVLLTIILCVSVLVFLGLRIAERFSDEYDRYYEMDTERERRQKMLNSELRRACEADNVRRAAILLIRGADPNDTNDWYGRTMLGSSQSEAMNKLLRAFGGKTPAELEAEKIAARKKAAKLSPEEREEKNMKFVNKILSVKQMFFWTQQA